MGPFSVKPVGLVGFVVGAGLEFCRKIGLKFFFHALDLALGHEAVFDEAICIERQRGLLLFDLFVHQRVGEHRLVALIVTKAAVTNDVENHVFVELLAEFCGDAGGVHHGFGVVTVDVENRRFDHQRDISRVGR